MPKSKNEHLEFIKILLNNGYRIYRQYEAKHSNTMLGTGRVWLIALLHKKLNPIDYEIWKKDLKEEDLNQLHKLKHAHKY